MAIIVFEDSLAIPDGIDDLAGFRRWLRSDSFPEPGRIDYLGGRIEVHTSPDELFAHNALKTEMTAVLGRLTKDSAVGDLFMNPRIASIFADYATEPDIVYVSHETLITGGARLVPKGFKQRPDYIEIEGALDLVAEVVGDSSVAKDTRRLPPAYFAAGVTEFWLVDAREDELVFRIHRRGDEGFVWRVADREGYQRSSVLGRRFRLDRRRNPHGRWRYDLLHAE